MGNDFIVTMEKITPGGNCLGYFEGKAVFVPLTLPGETLRVKPLKTRKKFILGEMTELLSPSDLRVEPKCPYYGTCGGCNLMHTSYDTQLVLKQDMLRQAFRLVPEIGDFMGEMIPSRPWNYRNRLQFHSGDNGVGFKAAKSNRIISVNQCPVAVDAVNNALKKSEIKVSSGNRKNVFAEGGYLFQSGVVDVMVADKRFQFGVDHFFQSNLSILTEFINRVGTYIEGKSFYDLYAGCGLFSQCLSEKAELITAVEEFPGAKKWYLRNTGFSDAHFISSSIEHWIASKPEIVQGACLVVDPPRTGLSKEVRAFLGGLSELTLVYVSCDYITQARDSRDLLDSGYQPVAFKAFDFSPQTSRMETLCIYEK